MVEPDTPEITTNEDVNISTQEVRNTLEKLKNRKAAVEPGSARLELLSHELNLQLDVQAEILSRTRLKISSRAQAYQELGSARLGLARVQPYANHRTLFNFSLLFQEVIRLETQYWTLVDIPKQEKQETVPAFVLRACAIMEKTQKSGEGVKTSAKLAEEAQDKRERIERLENMTTSQIDAENTQMTNDLYRLLKKYSGLRNLIRQLKTEYTNAKLYPMVLRYSMLKDMIKDIMLHPDYMEVCHEVDA
ncbi:uncharacterized protein LOC126885498 [Diabrotica virgifera virgifera]|uniref:Uncharacterized protein n=1 Tax=Diabrotica virgifera virgifera TaxID=50390 RepID=A0ABM5KCW9_DIAVI|nr:uncharacterized protein LOC126885498 [Diabrotica virgifera virgifera]